MLIHVYNPSIGGTGKEDHFKTGTSLGYIVRSRLILSYPHHAIKDSRFAMTNSHYHDICKFGKGFKVPLLG